VKLESITMTEESHIVYTVENGVAHLKMNRPRKLNAITTAMSGEFVRICKEVDYRDDIKVLVISGAGDRPFSAGSDVGTLDDLGEPWEQRNRSEYDRDYIAPLLKLRKPAIAAIDGYCLGGGLEVAMSFPSFPRSMYGECRLIRSTRRLPGVQTWLFSSCASSESSTPG
jgi:enoyl-CoA hydratase